MNTRFLLSALLVISLFGCSKSTTPTAHLDRGHAQGTPLEGDGGGGGGPQGVNLSLLPASQSVARNTEFRLILTVSASDVGAWNTVYDIVTFDTTRVQYVRQSLAPFLLSFCNYASNYPQQAAQPGQCVVLQGIACYQTFTTSAGTLDTLVFRSRGVTGSASLVQTTARLNDGTVYLSPVNTVNAAVTVN